MIDKTQSAAQYNTPMMRQYMEIKSKHKTEILFFRMGDFYEMFFDDAVYASKILGIALTKRQDGIPMCGVPYHAVNNYVHPILEDGKNIAVCEQMETPAEAEGPIVRREVVRILTPGTIYEEHLLGKSESRLIASAVIHNGNSVLALADISTGDIWIEKEEGLMQPGLLAVKGIREVVLEESRQKLYSNEHTLPLYYRRLPSEDKALSIIKKTFHLENVQVLELSDPELNALGLLFIYIYEVIPQLAISWKNPVKEYLRRIMHLDETVVKTLEIITSQSGEKESSLLGVMDKTITASGRRLLIQFLMKPSTDLDEIRHRQNAVKYCLANADLVENIKNQLRHVYDIERLISSLQNHPEVRHLGNIFITLQVILQILREFSGLADLPEIFRKYWQKTDFPENLYQLLKATLYMQDLPPLLDERRFVSPGQNAELDDLFSLGGASGDIILDFEKREKMRLDIPALKVRYNKVIGYYIEISKGQANKAPPEYSRRQTLVNAERYTCEELKNLEDKILGARERIIDLQRIIFDNIVEEVLKHIAMLRYWAQATAFLDVIFSFAKTAFESRFVCPEVSDNGLLFVKNSRHPVVESLFKTEVFVPNDIHLNNENRHLAILTGPNMAGKSTYIRQVGILQILAQTGSFVPAEMAHVGLVDRIFTRIGAFDRLARGESTFYVEMSECAKIFRNFTSRSLILLDEIGRGTSTFDGISIARAMIEFLNNTANGRPKILFATHYAELSSLIESDRGIIGLTVKILEEKDKIIFLRKIIEGSADKSYGIYVAQLAGIQDSIIQRASTLLKELEQDGIWSKEPVFQEIKNTPKPKKENSIQDQLSMF